MKKDPVPIVGFSDLTVLLSWAAGLGFRSVHGPVLTQFGELDASDQLWLLDLLRGQQAEGPFAAGLRGSSDGSVREGMLVGGNLSLLAHLSGTPWAVNFRDAICIIEDVGERPYSLDRYLQQLLLQDSETGLREASAVLLGDFSSCEEPQDDQQDPIDVVLARLRAAGLASAAGLPLGHGKRNRAFPFGARARLDGDSLWLLESALEL
jgi:muramoyltetrapeptide carboxypeptidase